MRVELKQNANLGKRVQMADLPDAVGEVTLDLRRSHIQPPRGHVLLYVRFDPTCRGKFGPGTWATPDQLDDAPGLVGSPQTKKGTE